MTYQLLLNSTANAASGETYIKRIKETTYGFVQVDIEGTGGSPSVQMQGKLSEAAPWSNIGSAITTSGTQEIDLLPIMQAVPSGLSGSNTVSVWITD
jgi:hypothetical protein